MVNVLFARVTVTVPVPPVTPNLTAASVPLILVAAVPASPRFTRNAPDVVSVVAAPVFLVCSMNLASMLE